MKLKKILPVLVAGFMFVGCTITDSGEVDESSVQQANEIDATDDGEVIVEDASTDDGATTDSDSESEKEVVNELTDDMARDAIWKYICTEENLEAGDYDGEAEVGCIVTSEKGADEIVIDYKSYTGAHEYFYIDRATGDTHSTEFVPGISDDEVDTGLVINVWDYVD